MPIFAASDIPATVEFYKEVVGCNGGWMYGDPPAFGGASLGGASFYFALMPELAAQIEGHQHWVNVNDVDKLYSDHLERGADVISPIEDKPWGFREYTVRDLNGYHLRFTGNPARESKGTGVFPEGVKIERRLPTRDEFATVTDAAFGPDQHRADTLANSWNGVVAFGPDAEAVGVVRIMHDADGWFSVWDVAVLPDWQGQRIGSAMMQAALELVSQDSPGAAVYLFTMKGEFYERLGFEKKSLHQRRA